MIKKKNINVLRPKSGMLKRKDVTEVFTPRNSEVNKAMYIARPELEKILLRSIKKNIHSLMCGESGNGKSWLYKKVLSTSSIPFVIANCANASRHDSVTIEICNAILGEGVVKKVSYSEGKTAKANAYVFEAGLENSSNYEIYQNDPLLTAFSHLGKKTKGRKVIVLDNLESIFRSKPLMNELADILILLDDNRYSEFDVNFLVVGIPNDVIEYFSKTKNMESVSNRLEEVQKVGSLSQNQVKEFISKGFNELKIPDNSVHIRLISKHVHAVTMGVAQRVHEYCECLAYKIEDNNWTFSVPLLAQADLAWLLLGLRKSYNVLESHLNSRETAVARRNQVIYVMGKITTHQFDAHKIDSMIRSEFPNTIPETNMGIGPILNALASGSKPLLKKIAKRNEFYVTDPRYIMCIRVALLKEENSNKVLKKAFSR